jgi:hypothetical protein
MRADVNHEGAFGHGDFVSPVQEQQVEAPVAGCLENISGSLAIVARHEADVEAANARCSGVQN